MSTATLRRMWTAWTSPDGMVHCRIIGTSRTLCGIETGPISAQPATSCTECVNESIREYARTHVCGPECHAEPPPHETTAAGLPLRVPQNTEGAKLARQMSWTGQIPIDAYCTDIDLMASLIAALNRY